MCVEFEIHSGAVSILCKYFINIWMADLDYHFDWICNQLRDMPLCESMSVFLNMTNIGEKTL